MSPQWVDPWDQTLDAIRAKDWVAGMDSALQTVKEWHNIFPGIYEPKLLEAMRECENPLLHRACEAAVQQGDAKAAESLFHWHKALVSEEQPWQALAQQLGKRDSELLLRRAEALLIAARIALAARRSSEHPERFIRSMRPFLRVDEVAEAFSTARIERTLAQVTEAAPTTSIPPEVELVDTLFGLLSATPGEEQARHAFCWERARHFLGAPKSVMGRASVAVARVGTAEEQGYIDDLEVEVLAPGTGVAFHHPEDIFYTFPDSEFESAMQEACTRARQSANSGGVDGRWRLKERPSAKPVETVDGRSASGAAARGWWYALQDKVPDPEVIVLAQVDDLARIDRHEPPQGVGGVCAKTRAIAQAAARRFDTIIVASDKNQREAEAELRQLGQSGRMKVENLRVSNV